MSSVYFSLTSITLAIHAVVYPDQFMVNQEQETFAIKLSPVMNLCAKANPQLLDDCMTCFIIQHIRKHYDREKHISDKITHV